MEGENGESYISLWPDNAFKRNSLNIRVLRDQKPVAEFSLLSDSFTHFSTGSVQFIDSPPAGTYTYTIEVLPGFLTGEAIMNNICLAAFEL
jgi:hypothetical protein